MYHTPSSHTHTYPQLNGEIRQFHGVGVIGDGSGRINKIFTGKGKKKKN